METSRGATGTSTRLNWSSLQAIALQYLKIVYSESPNYTAYEILKKLNLPPTRLFLNLAGKAGFGLNAPPGPELICAIAALLTRGVMSEHTIAIELEISPELVRSVLESNLKTYGSAPYGTGFFGGSRRYSDGSAFVPRRVTMSGQMSYRGENYTLGASYRGRRAMIREKGDQLLVTFLDRPSLCLHRRKWREVNAER